MCGIFDKGVSDFRGNVCAQPAEDETFCLQPDGLSLHSLGLGRYSNCERICCLRALEHFMASLCYGAPLDHLAAKDGRGDPKSWPAAARAWLESAFTSRWVVQGPCVVKSSLISWESFRSVYTLEDKILVCKAEKRLYNVRVSLLSFWMLNVDMGAVLSEKGQEGSTEWMHQGCSLSLSLLPQEPYSSSAWSSSSLPKNLTSAFPSWPNPPVLWWQFWTSSLSLASWNTWPKCK